MKPVGRCSTFSPRQPGRMFPLKAPIQPWERRSGSYQDATFSLKLPALIHMNANGGENPHRERIGSWNFSCAHAMNRFRSALLIPPIGLTSAINVRGTPSEQRMKGKNT
jgi:hypothetical protein